MIAQGNNYLWTLFQRNISTYQKFSWCTDSISLCQIWCCQIMLAYLHYSVSYTLRLQQYPSDISFYGPCISVQVSHTFPLKIRSGLEEWILQFEAKYYSQHEKGKISAKLCLRHQNKHDKTAITKWFLAFMVPVFIWLVSHLFIG